MFINSDALAGVLRLLWIAIVLLGGVIVAHLVWVSRVARCRALASRPLPDEDRDRGRGLRDARRRLLCRRDRVLAPAAGGAATLPRPATPRGRRFAHAGAGRGRHPVGGRAGGAGGPILVACGRSFRGTGLRVADRADDGVHDPARVSDGPTSSAAVDRLRPLGRDPRCPARLNLSSRAAGYTSIPET